MNFYQSITSAMDIALEKDPTAGVYTFILLGTVYV